MGVASENDLVEERACILSLFQFAPTRDYFDLVDWLEEAFSLPRHTVCTYLMVLYVTGPNQPLSDKTFLSFVVLQDGTEEYDYIFAAAGADDGSVIIAGYTYGSYEDVNAGSSNFGAVKIDGDGNTVWKWQVRSVGVGHD